jgi:hypothetical protein
VPPDVDTTLTAAVAGVDDVAPRGASPCSAVPDCAVLCVASRRFREIGAHVFSASRYGARRPPGGQYRRGAVLDVQTRACTASVRLGPGRYHRTIRTRTSDNRCTYAGPMSGQGCPQLCGPKDRSCHTEATIRVAHGAHGVRSHPIRAEAGRRGTTHPIGIAYTAAPSICTRPTAHHQNYTNRSAVRHQALPLRTSGY